MNIVDIATGIAIARPSAQTVSVASSTGAIYTIPRLLGSASIYAVLSSNANLSLNTTSGAVSATAAISPGASQNMTVSEIQADGSGYIRPFTFSANPVVPSAPVLSGAPGDTIAILSWVDGSNGGANITSHNIYRNGVLIASPLMPTLSYTDTGLTNGTAYSYQVTAVNSVGEGALSTASVVTPIHYVLPTLSSAMYDGDSRTANMGARIVSGGTASVYGGGYGTAPNMMGLVQGLCGNKWVSKEGYQKAVGGSTTLAMLDRSTSTSIAATGNPAYVVTGSTNAADNKFSVNSDGVNTVYSQPGNYVFTASASVNDLGYAYYASPYPASQTFTTIAAYADALGAAGKTWYVGNEFPRGGSAFFMEAHTVTANTCTATNVSTFTDGESYGAPGVIGVFASGLPVYMTKVSSSPGQNQYTVTSAGVYIFGGTAPITAYLTYNAAPPGGLVPTPATQKVVNEWYNSSASNFVSVNNGINYGLPGLQYNRPWVRVVDTFDLLVDPTTGSQQLALPGTFDTLQLHGTVVAAYKTAQAFTNKFNVDFPSAPALDAKPIHNNWYAARGVGSLTTYSGTLPPTMRVVTPTIISIASVPIASVNTTTGAITGTGITSGSLNFTTGAWTITFASGTSAPLNAQIWFEQDIGNYNTSTMMEGTIGRNMVMNGLMDMTPASGTQLTTTTGVSSITGITNSQIPWGWTLSGANFNSAIAAGTASIAVSSATTSDGYPRFVISVQGTYASAAPQITLQSPNVPSSAAMMNAGDKICTGVRNTYGLHPSVSHFYGSTGIYQNLNISTSAVTRNSTTGPISVTQLGTRISDGGTGLYMDDTLITAAGGMFDMYRVSPQIDTSGAVFGSTSTSVAIQLVANTPFAGNFGFGQIQSRRRNDF